MPALRAFLRTQDYPLVPALQRPLGDEMNVVDAEVERDGRRIVFSDVVRGPRGLQGVNAYVVSVDDRPFGGWFDLQWSTEERADPGFWVHVASAWERVDDDPGRLLTMEEFPNGVEWSACATGSPWLVYSAWSAERGTSAVEIHRRQRTSGGAWESPFDPDQEVMSFEQLPYDVPFDRYLFAASASEDLTRRVFLYVRQVHGVPWNDPGRRAAVCWCVDSGAAETKDHPLVEVPSPVNVASSPVRLVPDVYACVALVQVDLHYELQWWSLYEDPATAVGGHHVTVLHAYDSATTLPGAFPVSVGCRRYPGQSRFLVYAIWQDLLNGVSWIDSFQVESSGQVGGDLPSVPPATGEVAVRLSRRIVPRLSPNDGRAFLVDDESFTGPDGLPYVVGSVAPLGGPDHSADVQAVRFHTICLEPEDPFPTIVLSERQVPGPGGVELSVPQLGRVPTSPTALQGQRPVLEAPITPDTAAERTDAEPLIVDGRVFVFYIRMNGLEGRFWRAEGLP